ncbi:MAG TPA: transposase [Candidatus Saccharimonadales bacterium]|nr:transposase [Candidatus Saccharimonadales bacterium]
MPSRNIVKQYIPESYYHIYNRGVDRQAIFKSPEDFAVFLSIIKRHLSNEPAVSKYGHPHPHYKDHIELLAFCLMPNHFHLLVYQFQDGKAISKLVQSILTAYTMYFNNKYRRTGRLFQGTFKASRISQDKYLQHISRYIHLNPRDYRRYKWSSLPYYLDGYEAEWIKPQRILDIFEGDNYENFLKDYQDHKAMLDEIKHELADYSSRGVTLRR